VPVALIRSWQERGNIGLANPILEEDAMALSESSSTLSLSSQAYTAAEAERLPEGVSVQPRRFVFRELDEMPQYYIGGNPILTHFENAFSLLIPPGEIFFVRSVRHYQGRVTDPEFSGLIRAFAQQEGLHTNAHNEFNRSFARFGVDVDREVAYADRVMKSLGRWLPRKIQLGMTVFLEHLTAVGAHVLFAAPEVKEIMHPEAFRFWRWHAAEELEHKAVAFDLFKEVGGGYFMRMLSAWVAIVCLAGPMIRIARRMMRDDPTRITPEMREQARALQRNINRMQLPMLRAYFRPSFHPWQVHDEVHLQEWYASPETA